MSYTLSDKDRDRIEEYYKIFNDATNNSENLVFRNLILINGGAAIALLAYIGAFPLAKGATISDSLLWFADGVATAALGTMITYLVNYSVSKAKSFLLIDKVKEGDFSIKCASWMRSVIFIVGFVSLGCFVIGIWEIHDPISQLANS